MTDKMRADFEAFWRETMNIEEMDLHRNVYPGTAGKWAYSSHETSRSWMTWQAATAKATLAERERCALVCDAKRIAVQYCVGGSVGAAFFQDAADAIRMPPTGTEKDKS